jgi:hypothetical protein
MAGPISEASAIAFSSEVGTGSREENALRQAFSSEVGTGSREENALRQAFSNEVGTGSREENCQRLKRDPAQRMASVQYVIPVFNCSSASWKKNSVT